MVRHGAPWCPRFLAILAVPSCHPSPNLPDANLCTCACYGGVVDEVWPEGIIDTAMRRCSHHVRYINFSSIYICWPIDRNLEHLGAQRSSPFLTHRKGSGIKKKKGWSFRPLPTGSMLLATAQLALAQLCQKLPDRSTVIISDLNSALSWPLSIFLPVLKWWHSWFLCGMGAVEDLSSRT